jgi:hypothetical protein
LVADISRVEAAAAFAARARAQRGSILVLTHFMIGREHALAGLPRIH